jgi:hypothetical protein
MPAAASGGIAHCTKPLSGRAISSRSTWRDWTIPCSRIRCSVTQEVRQLRCAQDLRDNWLIIPILLPAVEHVRHRFGQRHLQLHRLDSQDIDNRPEHIRVGVMTGNDGALLDIRPDDVGHAPLRVHVIGSDPTRTAPDRAPRAGDALASLSQRLVDTVRAIEPRELAEPLREIGTRLVKGASAET